MSGNRQYLPECWNDEVRMNYLFKKFRNRDVNPTGYDDKMNFWCTLILHWSKISCQAAFTITDLKRAFLRQGKSPECLPVVIEEILKEKEIITLDEYITDNKGWATWGFDWLVKKPASWGWGTLKWAVGVETEADDTKEFVNVTVIKEIASAIMVRHTENDWLETTVDSETLWNRCKDFCSNKRTFELVLILLEKQRDISVFKEESQTLIKFKGKDSKESVVSPADIGLVRLDNAKKELVKQIDGYNKELDKLKAEAKQCLQTGHKVRAKSILKRKKRLEEIIHKKESTIDNIDDLVYQLKESKYEGKVLEAYRSGVKAFKSVAEKGGLNYENLDSTMDEIQEVVEMQEEINFAMAKPVFVNGIASDDELEAELDDLMRNEPHSVSPQPAKKGKAVESSPDRELAARLARLRGYPTDNQLPEVPTTEPVSKRTIRAPSEEELYNS